MALSDLLFVRGEDSLARAVQLGKPFLWQAYRQENDYQLVKVEAFLKHWSSLVPPGALESFLTLWYHYNGNSRMRVFVPKRISFGSLES